MSTGPATGTLTCSSKSETWGRRVFLDDIVKEKLLSLGARTTDPFLVAVSGGADSTALLLAMKGAVGEAGDLTVAHLDHGLRPDSESETATVVRLCRRLGVPPVLGRLDPGELETQRRRYGSLEAGMRRLRYRFLLETAEKVGSKWIVTGHTADDQAETVLFRAIRKMDWRSFRGIPEKRGMILRPLIDVSRSGTRRYCDAAGVTFLTDPSNYDETFARSRIRHRILPGLETTFSDGVSDLLRRMGRTAEAMDLAEESILNRVNPGLKETGVPLISVKVLSALPEILQKRVVSDFLVQVSGEYPSQNLVDDVQRFILTGRNGRLSLSRGMTLTLSYGQVHAGSTPGTPGPTLPAKGLELPIPGKLVIASAEIVITASLSSLEAPTILPGGRTALLSEKRLKGPLSVRRRQPGDRFTPLGMGMDKKLKEFLVDRKVPRAIRDQIPIVLDREGDIVWVGGVEISPKAALDGVKGEKAVLIRIQDLPSAD